MRPIVWCDNKHLVRNFWFLSYSRWKSRRPWRENVNKAVRGQIQAEDKLIAQGECLCFRFFFSATTFNWTRNP